MVIKLEHPIIGFERSNIELWTLFDSSLTIGHPLRIMESVLLNYLIWNIVKPIDGFVSKEMFLNAFSPVNLLFQSNWYLIPKQISASLSFAILTTDWQWQVDLASSYHKSVSGYGLELTMLQKLSKCEVKACLYWNWTTLPPLQFCVKSNFEKFKRTKNIIFGNFIGSEFWLLVNLSNFQVQNLPKFKVLSL